MRSSWGRTPVLRPASTPARAVEAAPRFFAAHAVPGKLLAKSGGVEKRIQEPDMARERAEFLRLKQLADETVRK